MLGFDLTCTGNLSLCAGYRKQSVSIPRDQSRLVRADMRQGCMSPMTPGRELHIKTGTYCTMPALVVRITVHESMSKLTYHGNIDHLN